MTEEKSITEEAAPAEATQVVEPIAIEAAQAGDTAVLEPAADVAAVSSGPDSVEEPVLENPAKPKKKRRKAPIIILIILVLLLGAAAALEFIPGSPFEHTIRWLIDPPTQATEQLSRATGGEPVTPETISIEVGVVLDVPSSWEAVPVPEPEPEEEAAEAEDEAPAGEEEAEEPAEPTAAEKLAELRARAFEAIAEGSLRTSAPAITLTPLALSWEASNPFGYIPAVHVETIEEAAEAAKAARYAAVETELTTPFGTEAVEIEPGTWAVSGTEYIFDELGFAWKTDGTEEHPLEATFGPDAISEQIFYHPVDLASLDDGSFASLAALAGPYSGVLTAARELACAAAAEEGIEPEPEPEPDPEPEPEPDQPGPSTPSQGTNSGGHSGGNSSGNTNPGGNSGNGNGNQSGTTDPGNSGNGSGTTTPTDPNPPSPGHTHTTATRDVYIGTQDVTVVDVPGHMGTVHHDAVYNDWTEHFQICSTCGVRLGGDVIHYGSATQHLLDTGHEGYYSGSEHHHDLVSEAWDEETWIPDQSHTVTYAMYVTETYCLSCGEVLSTSAPWHY